MPFDPKSAKKAGKKSKRGPAKKEESTIKQKMELLYEEIAFKMKFINLKKLKELAKPFGDSSYGKYLKLLVNENQ
tara:strand:+ start:171 stop:395 length:225 start_codon:yes stop_codon:yes gene_type:complete